jgi:hypothetical protein
MFLLNENPIPIRDRKSGLAKELSAVICNALARNLKTRIQNGGPPQVELRHSQFPK